MKQCSSKLSYEGSSNEDQSMTRICVIYVDMKNIFFSFKCETPLCKYQSSPYSRKNYRA